MDRREHLRETQLRRRVARTGFRLEKNRRRDRKYPDHGLFRIVDPRTGVVESGAVPYNYSLDVDDVELWLRGKHG